MTKARSLVTGHPIVITTEDLESALAWMQNAHAEDPCADDLIAVNHALDLECNETVES